MKFSNSVLYMEHLYKGYGNFCNVSNRWAYLYVFTLMALLTTSKDLLDPAVFAQG